MASPQTAPAGPATPRWRRALVVLLTAAALGVLAVFLFQNRDYIAANYAPRPGAFVAIAALITATLGMRGLAHQVLFAPLGIGASAADWFRLTTVSSFANYLPLSAGMVAKAFVLKRVHALPYRRFAVGQIVLLIVVVSTNGVVGFATLAVAFPEHLVGIVGAGFAAMSATAALMFVPSSALRWLPDRLPSWQIEATPSLRRAWPAAALFQVGNLLATAASFQIAFAMGASEVGFAACTIFSAAAMLTRLVAVTPGAIGIREFLVGGLAYLTGFELRDAVIASTAVRTVEIVVIFALGGLFTHGLSNQVLASYADREAAKLDSDPP